MGDSGGSPQPFDDIDDDIEAAIGALCANISRVRGVALWGLCDAASAAALYASRRDPRLLGIALVNPWVRSEEGQAKAQIKHYYRGRLASASFWTDLLRGRIAILPALSEAGRALWRAARMRHASPVTAPVNGAHPPFQMRMAGGLGGFDRPTLVLLSGRDLTAREFADLTGADRTWRRLMQRPNVRREELPDADHTFSNGDSRAQVERLTREWLASLDGSAPRKTADS
jgi:exosortase A-associated hydrolase 1